MNRPPRPLLRRALAPALAALALGICAPLPAHAHFILQTPASWMSQDALGIPEKLGPCGNEGGGTATGTVTAFQEGQTITVTVNEVIFHPGHYRIALSVLNRSELPAEPVVTAGSTPCGSVPIMSPPVFPVLADGLFVHTQAFTSPQTTKITLPPGVTCTHCTLQVIEFMSDHPLNNPGGCFYHHCADLSIGVTDGGTSDTDGGISSSASSSSGAAASTGATGGSMGAGGAGGAPGGATGATAGCGCSVPAGSSPGLMGLAALLWVATSVRRRRR